MRRKQWQGWIALLFVFAWMNPCQAIPQATSQSELLQCLLTRDWAAVDIYITVRKQIYSYA